jgi:uncharacterized protein YqfB (UPF0267 family)
VASLTACTVDSPLIPFSASVQAHADMAEVTLEFLQDLIKEEYPDVTVNIFEVLHHEISLP